MFNREMDSGLNRNQITSQGILQDENSRRRNAQYKSIAHRALRYDHLDQNSLARKSPYLQDAGKALEGSGAVPAVPLTKPTKKAVRRKGRKAQNVEIVDLTPLEEYPEVDVRYVSSEKSSNCDIFLSG